MNYYHKTKRRVTKNELISVWCGNIYGVCYRIRTRDFRNINNLLGVDKENLRKKETKGGINNV